jgi:hypothetical protein
MRTHIGRVCRNCGEPFTKPVGSPGFIDECLDCQRAQRERELNEARSEAIASKIQRRLEKKIANVIALREGKRVKRKRELKAVSEAKARSRLEKKIAKVNALRVGVMLVSKPASEQ